ncbi:MAG: hypothetical protein FJ276_04805 [Planctomycetes bacterium]|nr:hypothetical protein [Planctomycetota bacterium]
MCTRRLTWLLLLTAAGSPIVAADLPASRLRLVPFPKEVEMLPGVFALDRPLSLTVPTERAEILAAGLRRELDRAGCGKLEIASGDAAHAFSLAAGAERATQRALPEQMPAESYVLEVRPEGIACYGADAAGLYYGMQTLCQLIRANRRDKCLPCLRIRDWPSLRWRCYQDDLTRGPSSTLETLQQHVELGSELKMNLFTYYMEYQFAFKKHPAIGPPEGSLVPEDLAAVVSHAKARHVDVLGNQQSFGHFSRILAHPEYAALRETESLLCPVKEESYRLLDDLYSEVCPLLPFPMFNVCCDETWGLGSGPSKTLAEQIGVGGVYVGHIRRVHDLLRDKYSKRMMMWGDIILQHPEHLDQVPKDTVMLTWGYGAQDSFEDQIVPFARSGYEFFVCPGISNWSRILPDFGVATLNIRNFVRDGVKHGTLGMLNTEWEDDGEALQGSKWHGYAWGAECAWNGSTTDPRDFNRRVGAVLFGEPGDHFGQAVELLAQTHPLPGMKGMNNARFWENDFLPRQTVSNTRTAAQRLLQIVQPAIEHLQACKEDAAVNAPLLDAFLLGARRMELIGCRMRDGLRAAEAYASACETTDGAERQALLKEVETLVSTTRRAHAELGDEFKRLWLSESKPYALDWTMSRYAHLDAWYRDLEARVADAMKRAERGEGLPTPEELGLALPTVFSRRTRPHGLETVPLPSAAWAEPAPGDYLFPDGKTGPVGKESDGVSAQVKAGPVHWAIKSNSLGLALGMTTPEVAAHYVVAPGAGAGGVGIENSPPACHFVTFAGLLTEDPHTTMTRLHQTLCFRNQPEVVLYALEERRGE